MSKVNMGGIFSRKARTPVIVGYVVVVLAAISLATIAFIQKPTASNSAFSPEAVQQLSSSLKTTLVAPSANTITSELGFITQYDATALDARAQTTDPASTDTYVFGEEFTGDDMATKRPYSMYIFEVKSPNADTEEFPGLKARLNVSTNIRDTYFTSREAMPEYQGMPKIDILVAQTTKNRTSNDSNVTASEPTDIIIQGVSYKKVTYTTSVPSLIGDAPYITSEETYMTVQNGRPYWASISLITERNKDEVALLRPVIASTAYPVLDSDGTDGVGTYTNTSAGILEIPKGGSYVPTPLASETIIPVVVKNQPAVVRVGAINCFDGTLKDAAGKDLYTFKRACAAGIGSGSIVSADGYIATNGHVTSVGPGPAVSEYGFALLIKALSTGDYTDLASFLQYFVDIQQLTPSEMMKFMELLKQRDSQAVNTLATVGELIPESQLAVTSKNPSYIIQTSNDPIRLVDPTAVSDYEFKYTKTNVPAKFIDQNYGGAKNLTSIDTPVSDVAILKMEGSNFPVVKFGSISAIDGEDRLTAIGYPAFVDGGLTTKNENTVPAVTQGKVVQISNSQYKLILTTVPIASGNSGGPAFNDAGEQIGLNTYGVLQCADKKCFGDGIVRDVADFQQLLSKNGIALNTNSSTTNTWNEALDAYASGNFKAAEEGFSTVADTYPANYLAEPLAELAKSQVGTSGDTSSQSSLFTTLIIAAAVTFVAGVTIVTIAALALRVKRPKVSEVPVTGVMPAVAPFEQPVSTTTPVPQPTFAQPAQPIQPAQPSVNADVQSLPQQPVVPNVEPQATPALVDPTQKQ